MRPYQQALDLPEDLRWAEEQWRQIAVERGDAFMLPEWYACALRHYGDQVEPAAVTVTDPDGSLVGVMPMVADGGSYTFAGAGLGDWFRPVCRLGDERRVAEAASELISDGGRLVFDHVEKGDEWATVVAAASTRPMRQVCSKRDVLPHIDLGGVSWDGYLAGKSSNFRGQVRRKKRKLKREHAATFRCCESAGQLDRDLDTFYSLHDARWDPRGGSGMGGRRARRFHRDFAKLLLERDWLRLWFLELEGEPAATWYGWNVGGVYAYYLGGFAPRWMDQSPGFVLLSHTIEQAADEGCHSYELLRGDEGYKSRFETGRREVETWVLVGAGSPYRAVVEAEAMLWRHREELPDGLERLGREIYRTADRLMPTARRR